LVLVARSLTEITIEQNIFFFFLHLLIPPLFCSCINQDPSMALKPILASLLLSILLLHLTNAIQQPPVKNVTAPPPPPSPAPHPIDCGQACIGRCKASSRPNLCKRACGSCCHTCGCVPPGTSGNYEVCPCYFHLTTHNQTRKCP
jgi:hypothetical protein